MRNAVLKIATVLAALAGMVCLTMSSQTAKRSTGRPRHQVYVWQRHWDDTVTKALEEASPLADGFCILGAEVSWRNGRPRVARVRPDYDALRATGKPAGIALRIGPYAGPFKAEGLVTGTLTHLAQSLIADARAAGVEPSELQIDFDCAESKLDGYCRWVKVISEAVRPTPLTITALPCWLRRGAFRRLAKATNGYVLQVHSLERPAGPNAPMSLCDPARTRHWVEKAARIGVPFRVALPTYGYLVAFGKEGKFIALAAEGPSREWGKDVRLRVVRADPTTMAELVRGWTADRPADLQAIVWYRLPISRDRLNWSGVTLFAIMAGRVPREEMQIDLEYTEPELAELVLVNTGEVDLSPAVHVEVSWKEGKLLAADGLRGFAPDKTGTSKLQFQRDRSAMFSRIAPGERWRIGWMRFQKRTEVIASITSHASRTRH